MSTKDSHSPMNIVNNVYSLATGGGGREKWHREVTEKQKKGKRKEHEITSLTASKDYHSPQTSGWLIDRKRRMVHLFSSSFLRPGEMVRPARKRPLIKPWSGEAGCSETPNAIDMTGHRGFECARVNGGRIRSGGTDAVLMGEPKACCQPGKHVKAPEHDESP